MAIKREHWSMVVGCSGVRHVDSDCGTWKRDDNKTEYKKTSELCGEMFHDLFDNRREYDPLKTVVSLL